LYQPSKRGGVREEEKKGKKEKDETKK